jgi:hypothetical protein
MVFDCTNELKEKIKERSKATVPMKYKKLMDYMIKNGYSLYKSSNGKFFFFNKAKRRGTVTIPKYVQETLSEFAIYREMGNLEYVSQYHICQYVDNKEVEIFKSYELSDYQHYVMYKQYPKIKVICDAPLEIVDMIISGDKDKAIQTVYNMQRQKQI